MLAFYLRCRLFKHVFVWPGRESTLNKKDVVRGRVEHIDIARGISIALVALFHSDLAFFIPAVVEPMSVFRMPLFLVLSGVFFSWSRPPGEFLLKKADALLKPYFFVLFIAWVFYYVSDGEAWLWKLKGMFYGNGITIQWEWVTLWFLTHLFALYASSYVLFYFLRFDQLGRGFQLLVLLLFMIAGIFLLDVFWHNPLHVFGRIIELPGLPFSMDIILISSCYFILGSILRSKIVAFKPDFRVLLVATIVFVLIAMFTDATVNLNDRIYTDPVYAFVGAAAGIYGVLALSWWCAQVNWLRAFFLQLGKASLFIMIFHVIIGYWVYTLLSENVVDKPSLVFIALVAFIFSVLLPLVVKRIVERNTLLSLVFFPLKSNRQLRHALRVHRRAKAYAVVQK